MVRIEVDAIPAFRSESGRAKITEMGIKTVAEGDKEVTKAFIALDDGLPEIQYYTLDYNKKSVVTSTEGGKYLIKDNGKQVWAQAINFFGKLKIKNFVDLDPESFEWTTEPSILGMELAYDVVKRSPKKVLDGDTGKVSLVENQFNDVIITGLDMGQIKPASKEEKSAEVKVGDPVINISAWKDFLGATLVTPKTEGQINDVVVALATTDKAKSLLLKGRKKVLSQLVAEGFLVLDEENDKYSLVN